ncbi:Cadherin-like [Trinorchestia longiramus]|nr:Cadherin-like [Trinorchestia longiramus]
MVIIKLSVYSALGSSWTCKYLPYSILFTLYHKRYTALRYCPFRKDESTSCPTATVGAIIYVSLANLDYEEITSYKLIVQVSNSNARIDHSLTVRVVDVNDEVPLLQHPYSGVISENSDNHSLIMTVTAIDKDASAEFKQASCTEDLALLKYRVQQQNFLFFRNFL